MNDAWLRENAAFRGCRAIPHFSIPFVLALFVTERSDVAFGWVFWAFAIFILACGTTHVLGIWTLFYPDYGIEGVAKAITAAASLTTAIGLLPLLPKALRHPLAGPAARGEYGAAGADRRARRRGRGSSARRRRRAEVLRQSRKMDAVGQLTAGIAHDLNNLRTVIIGGLKRAKRRGGDNAELIRALDLSHEGARRAALLTKRLLAFGRQQALTPRVINARAARGHDRHLAAPLGERVRVVANLAREPWTVMADVPELQVALLNLGLNARDAMPNGGNIVVSTRNVPRGDLTLGQTDLAPTEYFEIAVSDNGSGMDRGVVERAFDPWPRCPARSS